jgi:hypothetical protein
VFILSDWDGALVGHIISRGNLEDKKETIRNQPHTKDWMTRMDDYK